MEVTEFKPEMSRLNAETAGCGYSASALLNLTTGLRGNRPKPKHLRFWGHYRPWAAWKASWKKLHSGRGLGMRRSQRGGWAAGRGKVFRGRERGVKSKGLKRGRGDEGGERERGEPLVQGNCTSTG